MANKGKFRLSSYLIEDKLIFFKDLNNSKNLIALFIFQSTDIVNLLPTLNEILLKRFIKYYAINILINSRIEYEIVLCFWNSEKEKIIKIFNEVLLNLKNNKDLRIYKREELKNQFFKIFSMNLNDKMKIERAKNSILIKTEESIFIYNYYMIRTDELIQNEVCFHELIKLIIDLNEKGNFIINISLNTDDKLKCNAIFIQNQINQNSNVELEKRINKFFNYVLLTTQKVNPKEIFKIFFRYAPGYDVNIPLKKLFTLFNGRSLNEIQGYLKRHNMHFHTISQDIVFIEDFILLIIIQKLDVAYLLKILKNYYPKYVFYILVEKDIDYKELVQIENINELNDLRILNRTHLNEDDISEIKNFIRLKNT